MKYFNVSFVIPENLMPTVFGLMTGHVSKWNITEVEKTVAAKEGNHGEGRSAVPTLRSKSWALVTAYVEKLKKGDEFTTASLAGVLVPQGFNESSASPMTTHLVRAGLVERVRQGVLRKL